jgi:hydrogenase maturation protease
MTTRPLILGIGNRLLGDEGIGSIAINYLSESGLQARAELLDGGTGGFYLLSLFREYKHLILIDASTDNHPLGTVSRLQPRYPKDFPPTLTAHDIGLKDLINAAALLGDCPRIDLITVSIGELSGMNLELSEPVRSALPQIAEMVLFCLDENSVLVPVAPVSRTSLEPKPQPTVLTFAPFS